MKESAVAMSQSVDAIQESVPPSEFDGRSWWSSRDPTACVSERCPRYLAFR